MSCMDKPFENDAYQRMLNRMQQHYAAREKCDDTEAAGHAQSPESAANGAVTPASHTGQSTSASTPPSPRPAWKQKILDDFAAWLDELEECPEADENTQESELPDLETLLREFAALKQEVRLQSRGSSRLSEKVEALSGELLDGVNRLEESLTRNLQDPSRIKKEATRKTVLAFVDVFEAINRTHATVRDLPPPPRVLWSNTARDAYKTELAEPLQILTVKADELKKRIGLENTVRLGAKFDADLMRVVGTTNTQAPSKTVTEVLKPGYRLHDEIVQVAEVHVEE